MSIVIMNKKALKPSFRYIGLSILIYSLLLATLPKRGHGWDTTCWKHWSTYIYENGLGNIYKSWTDYLPLYHYILFLFGKLQNNVNEVKENIHYLKAFTLVFHFVSGYFFFRLIKTTTKISWENALLKTLYYLLNIAILYNTLLWGQVDAILTCFIFFSFYFANKKNVLGSIVFYSLAISFKLQAIIFFPVIGLILLPEMISQFSFKKLLLWVITPIILFSIILLPFIIAGTYPKIWHVITNSSNKYPVVSMNAFNIWYLLIRGDLMQVKDNIVFLGISYKTWGLLMFSATSFFALFPLLKPIIQKVIHKKEVKESLDKQLIALSLIPLLFFFFNTQMHERYPHPAFIFIIAYGIIQKKPMIAVIACTTYFLSLEKVLKYLDVAHGTFIFFNEFIASLFLLVILWLFYDLYKPNFFKKQIGSKKV